MLPAENLITLDCLEHGRLLKVEYFHRPIDLTHIMTAVGSNVILSFDGLQSREIKFIEKLAEWMGMKTQAIKTDGVGLNKATHLVRVLWVI